MKKIILILLLACSVYAQEQAGYSFKDVGTWFDVAGPKRWLFGNSTVFHDSTNYLTLNKGFYVQDSLKVAKDLYVGVKGGVIYLDTNRNAKLEYSGNTFKLTSSKSNGGFYFDNTGNTTNAGFSFVMSEGTPNFSIYKYRNGQLTTAVVYDTLNGLDVQKGDIKFNNNYSTQQVKINGGDSVFTDWDLDDEVTCNLQSGRVLTKSLNTSALGDYALTLTNSLISTNTRIFCLPSTGVLSTGIPTIRAAYCGSGSATIVIYNASSSDPFNGTVGFQFLIINSP